MNAPASPPNASVLSVLGRRFRGRGLLPPGWAIAMVMAGGALGTAARYGLGQRFPVRAGTFPTITLVENVAGAALLGCLLTLMVARETPSRWLRPVLATGALGSFTTFSTFAAELVLLVDEREWALGALYAATTMALGVAAAVAGIYAARRFSSTPRRGARR